MAKKANLQNDNGRNATQNKLLSYVEQEIATRLNHSLHHYIATSFNHTDPLAQVLPPLNIEVEANITFPPDATIIDIYDHPEVGGNLLILGEPGAGKTTTLLQLAQVLARRAREDKTQPIPVLLNFLSWQKETHMMRHFLSTWLVESLTIKYGIREDVAERWVKDGVIAPLLDGFDELDISQQAEYVDSLNKLPRSRVYGERNAGFVVCSQYSAYQDNDHSEPEQSCWKQLDFNATIILQPLTSRQTRDYVLLTYGEELWRKISNDSNLLELAQTPLLLNIMIIAASEFSFEDWQTLRTREEQLHYLFSIYVRRMCQGESNTQQKKLSKHYTRQEIKHYLSWLATGLTKENQTKILTDKLQVTRLKGWKQKWSYRLISALIIQIVLFILPFVILKQGINGGVIGGSIFLFICSLGATSTKYPIKLAKRVITKRELLALRSYLTLRSDYVADTRINLTLLLILVVIVLIYSLSTWLVFQEIPYFNFLIFGLIGGFYYYALIWLGRVKLSSNYLSPLYSGLSYSDIADEISGRKKLNHRVFVTLHNCLQSTFICLMATGLISLCGQLLIQLESSFLIAMVFGVGYTFFIFFWQPLVEYSSLRITLWLFGDSPWNYAHFLDYCTDRLLVQRVGDGYRFMHDYLRRYFAGLPLDR